MYIKGNKILIRAIELKDAKLLCSMMNDPDIEQMMWGYSFPIAEHQQISWINNLPNDNRVFRGIIEVDKNAIGTIILTDIDYRNGCAEIHIKIGLDEIRRKGYGSDAVSALVSYCFNTLRLNCVYCRVKDDNIASQKMFTNCGFSKEGTLRARVFRDGKFHDFYEYSILKSEISK